MPFLAGGALMRYKDSLITSLCSHHIACVLISLILQLGGATSQPNNSLVLLLHHHIAAGLLLALFLMPDAVISLVGGHATLLLYLFVHVAVLLRPLPLAVMVAVVVVMVVMVALPSTYCISPNLLLSRLLDFVLIATTLRTLVIDEGVLLFASLMMAVMMVVMMNYQVSVIATPCVMHRALWTRLHISLPFVQVLSHINHSTAFGTCFHFALSHFMILLRCLVNASLMISASMINIIKR